MAASAPRKNPVASVSVRRHRLVAELAGRLVDRCGVAAGSKVVFATSGGPDSMALLLAACALRERGRGGRAGPALEPVAAHVNHHLRDSADRDAACVGDLCDRLGVPFEIRDVHPARCPGNVLGSARHLRYRALAEMASSLGAGVVATAHHAQDQLETLLIALCRGAGVDGLSGMAWSRPLEGDIRLIRPFLSVRKSDCLDLCRRAGVLWCEDPANVDPATVRGRLRREVLPVLEALWPDAASRATTAADLVAAARSALQEQVEAAFGDPSQRRWDRGPLRRAPVPVIAAGLRRAAVAAVPEAADRIGSDHLLSVAEAIHDSGHRPRAYDWPRGLRVSVAAREVALTVMSDE